MGHGLRISCCLEIPYTRADFFVCGARASIQYAKQNHAHNQHDSNKYCNASTAKARISPPWWLEFRDRLWCAFCGLRGLEIHFGAAGVALNRLKFVVIDRPFGVARWAFNLDETTLRHAT